MDAAQALGAYRFDRFTFDLGRSALLGPHGAEIPLRPTSFALLRLLIEHAGRAVDRDAIATAVWPGVTATDESIAQCVRDIRKALGDEAQSLLRAVPKRGYLLAAEVVPAESVAPPPRAERRLAAILAADIVGYSRLIEADETGTLAAIKALRAQAIDPLLAEHKGRIVKLMGDGAIVEFASVVDAVACAAAIQKAVAERQGKSPPERRIVFRIGINLGDVVVDEGDLLGDGVNVAARLEQLCEPGGVLVSGTAFDHLQGRLGLPLEFTGEQQVKNIARPVRAYRVRLDGSAIHGRLPRVRQRRWPVVLVGGAVGAGLAAALLGQIAKNAMVVSGGASTSPPPLSMVVLPFKDLGVGSDEDYFTDILTDDLTTDLARIDGSFVVAPATARTFKGKTVDATDIGKSLNVRYLVDGSVRRSESQVRVNVQLIDTRTGGEIWTDRFDADWSRTMALEDQITIRLARSLDIALTDAEGQRAKQDRPSNPDAVDLAMRGRALLNLPLTADNLAKARALFEQALAIDPGQAAALTGFARTLAAIAAAHVGADRDAELAQAETAIDKVLAVAPDDAMAHFVRGEILTTRKQFDEAIEDYRAAIAANRSLAPAYGSMGRAIVRAGHAADAIEPLQTAIRLSPRDPSLNLWYFLVCHAYSHLARDADAITWCSKSIERAPYWVAYVDLASAYAWQGESAEASAAVARLLGLKPGYTVDKWVHEDWSDNPQFLKEYARITEGLRKAGLPEA